MSNFAPSTRRWCAALAALALSTVLLPQAASAEDDGAVKERVASPIERARAAYDQGDWEDALDLYSEIYDASSSSSTARVEAALEKSSILWEQGSYRLAKALAEEAFTLAEEQRIDGAVGRLLVTIGHIETSQGKFSSARKTFKVCASLSEEGDDAVFAAICRMNIAMLDKLQGKGGGSSARFEKDIAALKGAKTPLATGSALAKTAELFAETGDPTRALEMLEQAQAQFSAAGSIPAGARNRIRIARVLQMMGDYDRARAHLKLGREALTKMNNRPALVDIHGLLGKDAEVTGDREGAVSHYKKALKLAKGIGNPQLTARANLALCELLASPLTEGATTYCESASKAFGKLGIKVLKARADIARAGIAQQSGELLEARELYTSAIEAMEGLSASQQSAVSLATQRANLCQVNREASATGALKSCEAALDALLGLDDPAPYQAHIAATYYNAGFSALSEERYRKALRNFEHAASAFMKSSPQDRLRSADAHLRMGIVYAALKDTEDEAIKAFIKGIDTLDGASGASEQRMKARIYQQLVQELVEQKKWQEAIARSEELIAFATPLSLHKELAYTYNHMAVAHLKLKDKAAARGALESGIEHANKTGDEADLTKLMRANLKKLK